MQNNIQNDYGLPSEVCTNLSTHRRQVVGMAYANAIGKRILQRHNIL